MDGRMARWTDGRKISPFYRTSFPIGAAAQKPGAKRHHMVSGTLAPLYTVFGLKLGCSGAAAPIGDSRMGRFSVHSSIRPFIHRPTDRPQSL